ncbi:MAG TPA: hypothetical protein VF516_23220 [Kofleriaceae bacterium]
MPPGPHVRDTIETVNAWIRTIDAPNRAIVKGVAAESGDGSRIGVYGSSQTETGVYGQSESGAGVAAMSTSSTGVFGRSESDCGVEGVSNTGPGVVGRGYNGGRGMAGFASSAEGVYGHSKTRAGVVGESDGFDGVFGISHNPAHAGVSGHNPGGLAGYFEGDVRVTGAMTVDRDVVCSNADCAEDFDVVDPSCAEPGAVMVLTETGALEPCTTAYDRRVAGVISGAGGYRPGIILDRSAPREARKPIALMGKVYCRADAGHGAIAVGDLLTTSPTPGHAMRVSDPARAFGAIVGKALAPLASGQGLIPLLVTRQ